MLRSLLLLIALAPVASAGSLPVQATTREGEALTGTLRLEARTQGRYALTCSWTSRQGKERLTGTLSARRIKGEEVVEGSVVSSAGFTQRPNTTTRHRATAHHHTAPASHAQHYR